MKVRITGLRGAIPSPARASAGFLRSTLCILATLAALGGAHETRAQDAVQQAFGALPGFGERQNYIDLDQGFSYTDNALLTAGNPVSDGVSMSGVDINYARNGSELDVNALGDIERLEYFDHSFPGSWYGDLDGSALWGKPTDLFQWQASDSFGEGMADPLAAPTPYNLETVNYLATGPRLNFNFGGTNRLTVYGLYDNTAYQKSPFNSQSYDGGVAFAHALSAISSLSLQVDSMHTEFTDDDEDAPSSYDTRDALLSYNADFAHTQVAATAGYTTLNYSGPNSGAYTFSLQLGHSFTESSAAYIRAQSGYSTMGASMQSGLNAPLNASVIAGPIPETATAAPFKDRLVTAGWNYHYARTTLSLLGTVEEQLYEGPTTFNSNNKSIGAMLTRQLRPTLSLSLQAYRTYDRYTSIDSEYTLTTVNLSLRKEFRKLGFSLYAQRSHQSSSDLGAPVGLVVGAYDADSAGVNVTYDLIGSRAPVER